MASLPVGSSLSTSLLRVSDQVRPTNSDSRTCLGSAAHADSMSCHSFHQWRAVTFLVLRAEVKKSSKGGGPGQWSAWKAAEMAKVRSAAPNTLTHGPWSYGILHQTQMSQVT